MNNLLMLAILASVFSQIDKMGSILRPVMYLSWIVVIGYGLIKNGLKIHFSKFLQVYVGAYFIWVIICIILTLFGSNHLNGNYVRIMEIPLLITVVAELMTNIDQDNVLKLCKVYVIAAVIFALWVNLKYFSSYKEWISSAIYTYAQKNSAAQIWSSAVLLVVFYLKPKSIKDKIFWYSIAGYLVVVSALSQCRTAILAMTFSVFVYVLVHSKYKLRIFLTTCVLFFIVVRIPFINQFIDKVFFISKYAGTDLNTMSSGRLDHWARSMNIFWDNMLFGCGKWYVDCSYLLVLAECGIVGFILIEVIWITRICTVVTSNNNFAGLKKVVLCMVVFYVIESLLEGFPPFGPGVSSFLFWLLCALSCRKQTD